MGAAGSITTNNNTIQRKSNEVVFKKLPDAIEEAIYVHEKFPLVIDITEQASRFFKYQTGSFIRLDDPIQSTKQSMNRSLVSALQHGRTMTVKCQTLENLDINILFQNKLFPKEVLDRSKFFLNDVWQSILQSSDPSPDEIAISSSFVFILCTSTEYVPPELYDIMHVIKVVDKSDVDKRAEEGEDKDPMDAIAQLYGAKEIIRNSIPLVEAAFDGDLDEVKILIDKGYHLESVDGRKHTALSEASCQGHMIVIKYLLDHGADPNSLSDTGRSSLWRASFNGHIDVVKLLLEAGASPEYRDKVSLESAYDVAQVDEIRNILNAWDLSRTVQLIEDRRRVILANLEARIKTSAEREFLARNIIRKELVDKATNGDVDGIKDMLEMIANEAIQSNNNNKINNSTANSSNRPRATVEIRSDKGQSLLSIAAQYDYEDLAIFLLTYWKDIDKDRWDLMEGEISEEAKIYKANPNSRDLKGWTCVCIAVFHDSRKVLKLLLQHGGDPNIYSSYHKNAWDLAKDELDAAEKVVKSNKEIRQVLIDYDQSSSSNNNQSKIFGIGKINILNNTSDNKHLYDELHPDGSPIIMNIEMNNENNLNPTNNKNNNNKEKNNKNNKKNTSKKGKK